MIFSTETVQTDGRRLVLNDISFTEAEFKKSIHNLLFELETTEEVTDLIKLYAKDKSLYSLEVGKIFRQLYSKARDEELEMKSESLNDVMFFEGVKDSCDLVVDGESGTKYVYNRDTQRIVFDLGAEAFQAHFNKTEWHEREKFVTNHVAKCIFNPTDKRGLIEKANGYCTLNLYNAPTWRGRDMDKLKTPKIFLEFLHHLFKNDKEQIEYVMGWLYRLIYSRNEVAVCLNGRKGTGKNVFYNICKMLCGRVYCSEAPKKFGQKEFNSFLRHRQLIGVDEHPITKGAYDTIKSYFNEYQTIEAKGVSVGTTEKVCPNFVFMHNHVGSLYLENAERRFSVMDITDTPLRDAWGKDKVDEFTAEIEDENSTLLAEIGAFITDYGESEEQDPFLQYKGTKYSEAIEYHLSPLVRSLIDLIEREKIPMDGVLTGKKINGNTAKFIDRKQALTYRGSTAQSEILEYKYRDTYSLGDVLNPSGVWSFQVNQDVIDLIAAEQE